MIADLSYLQKKTEKSSTAMSKSWYLLRLKFDMLDVFPVVKEQHRRGEGTIKI